LLSHDCHWDLFFVLLVSTKLAYYRCFVDYESEHYYYFGSGYRNFDDFDSGYFDFVFLDIDFGYLDFGVDCLDNDCSNDYYDDNGSVV